MRLFTKTVKNGLDQNNISYDIPNSTIASGAIILAIVQALAAILGNYISNIPKQQSDIVTNTLKEKNFSVQLLQRVLESPDSLNRLNSIKLLIKADLMQDPENKISEYIKTYPNIPRWEKHALEPISGNTATELKQDPILPIIKQQ